MKIYSKSLISARRALALVALATCGAVLSLSESAQAQTSPSNVQLLDQVLLKSSGSDSVEIDDMLFPRANFLDYRNRVASQADRQLSSAFYNTARWTGGNIYYSFDASLPATQRTAFLEACQEWQKWVNVKFTARTTQANYINVYHDASDGSFSYIGMVGGAQNMALASWATKWTACHEIGHALGVMHEQCRSDRGNYVTIDFTNVQSGAEGNFAIVADSLNKGAYDFDSVMHYFDTAFATNSAKPTIVCKPAYAQYQSAMGQRDHLSTLDKAGMVAIYGAPVTTYSVAGAVATANATGLSGVTMTLSSGPSVMTGTTGAYSFPSVAAGTYTITPSKAGYTFTPASRQTTVAGNATGLSFTASPIPAATLPKISITSVASVEGDAGASYMTFNVLLSQPSTQNVTVNFATVNGSALAGSDYAANSGILTLRAGSTMADIRISLLPDRIVEANETFTVVLSNPVGAKVGVGTGKGTIVNDDVAAEPAPALANDASASGG